MPVGKMDTLVLNDGVVEVGISPSLGASVAYYNLLATKESPPFSFFRPISKDKKLEAFDLGSTIMIPWAGRISGGGFSFNGVWYPIKPNLSWQELPIHGDGFAHAWVVEEATPTFALLTLESAALAPYHYKATAEYTLTEKGFLLKTVVTHLGEVALPYGVGYHPWFTRTKATTLKAKSTSVILEDSRYLPTTTENIAGYPHWNFNQERILPEKWINNLFNGWDGTASICWKDKALGMEIDCSMSKHQFTRYVVYSPGDEQNFFCFEPMSHMIDAHHSKEGAVANGYIVLEKAQTLETAMLLTPKYL
ncbi:MAG TPA: aldose 1-epimerase [Coxiellaceae bacterium]|nr:aldose 1-epimerase [Coxiellaceae bacterium]HBY55255.1 aldose 1-epimerase [Coxiellaceae bacterium]